MNVTSSGVVGESRNERLADAIIHALAIVGALAGAGLLMTAAARTGDAVTLAAMGVYVTALMLMPCVSAAYHHGTDARRRARFQDYDKATIFVFIAGTYTPFTLLAIGGPLGVGLLLFVWAVALAGVLVKLLHPGRLEKRLAIVLYLALGWCGLVALPALLSNLTPLPLTLLAAGGVLYTAGVAFHVREDLPFSNAVWHGFVLAAGVCHFISVRLLLPS